MDTLTDSKIAIYCRTLHKQRMEMAIEFLGGKCALCDETSILQMDHIDPSTKVSCVSGMSKTTDTRFWAEVKKCQLLCVRHHDEKTRRENPRSAENVGHGKLKNSRCRCEKCLASKRKHMTLLQREHRRRKKAGIALNGRADG